MRKHHAQKFSQGQYALFTPHMHCCSNFRIKSFICCILQWIHVFDETRVRVRTRIFCIFACHEFESRTLSLVELNRVTQFHFYCVFFMPISSFSNVCFSVKHFGGFCLSFVYLRFGCLSVKKSSFFGLIDNCLSYKYPSASQSLHILYISCNT